MKKCNNWLGTKIQSHSFICEMVAIGIIVLSAISNDIGNDTLLAMVTQHDGDKSLQNRDRNWVKCSDRFKCNYFTR